MVLFSLPGSGREETREIESREWWVVQHVTRPYGGPFWQSGQRSGHVILRASPALWWAFIHFFFRSPPHARCEYATISFYPRHFLAFVFSVGLHRKAGRAKRARGRPPLRGLVAVDAADFHVAVVSGCRCMVPCSS
jgi:hypothetical protein